MNELSDERLAWQPDIYQRYSFLARLTDILCGDGSGPLTLLDVGSGPVAVTAAFVSPRFDIVRADTGQFDDPSIVRLQPGEPLPFEDAAFDVAVAIEVLEHVPPAHRPSLIRELQRVSRQATIVCCPVDEPEVVEAERQFSACAEAVSGRDVDFLVEHRENGLPHAADVVSWFREPGSALVAENAPLDEWLAFNVLDFIYACDLGDHETKRRFAAGVNARAAFARVGAAHYRRFFCAFASPGHAATASRVIDAARSPNPSEPRWLVRELVTGILGWRQELRERSTREVEAKHRQIGEPEAALLHFKKAVAEKDAHIGKLDEALLRLSEAVTAKDAHIGKLDDTLVAFKDAIGEKDADIQDLDQQLAKATHSLQEAERALAQKDARLEETTRRSTAHERELQRILTSRSWRLTAPLRRFTEAFRHSTFIRACVGALAGLRRSVERATRRRNYALAAESGLFDATWYREHYPDVGRSNADPLVHYLKRGGVETRDPHRLFDARYYVGQTPPLPPDTNPLLHYVAIGARGGRDPHPLFSSSFYLEGNPDVAGAGINPLAHYLERGAREGRDPHPLFDSSFYLQSNPEAADVNPLVHYVAAGGVQGRDPHPLFSSSFYLKNNPDVAEAGVNPLAHYLERGAREGRDPHPLFDSSFYLQSNPDVDAAGVNPLVHYLAAGGFEGRDPHPLFSSSFYLESNPDVAEAGVNPLAHYLLAGGFEGRDPHPYFDSSFYLEGNPDVAAVGMNPLLHYVSSGGFERRAPHPDFDGAFYLASNPDVEAAGANPLVHYVTVGRAERRAAFAPRTLALERPTGYVPPHGRLPWFNPLNLVVAPDLVNEPRLNLLLPGLAMRHLSGGPNTALEIAGRLALSGVRVRFISTEFAFDQDLAPFRAHMRGLLGTDLPADVQLVSAHDRAVPMLIGARDLFMATAWWTAQQAKYAVRHTQHSRFVYLIQDYEPLFHPASTQQALAEETYSLDHLPVVNSRWLHEFLVRERIGRFADPAFVERSLVFQPAVNRTLFFPALDRSTRARRRLLFYARPTGGLRNLFELGVAALEKAVADGTLDPERWELVGMGESFEAVPLGRGARLVPAPWLDLAGYAQQMRESDILLSLMLSPHPSYPPLEMAACGGLAVTTAFANKTREALAELSANIIAIPPTLEGISEGLETAVARVDDVEGRRAAAAINLPASWRSSLAEVVTRLFDELAMLQGSPAREGERSRDAEGTSIVAPGFRNWPRDEYEVHRLQAFARRRRQYPLRQEPALFSLLTTVWNTPPEYLDALADSVLSQDADSTFEWVLLDNGSHDPGTRRSVERLAKERTIRFFRVDGNLGIIGGMRFCLERALHRYVLPVDSDDLLTPDCLRVLSHALRQAGYPALAYTDEDNLEGSHFSQPYFKPTFDPVLFANSCYTAHLGVIDRELALELGAYTDRRAEGSHDWDTFTRFLAAGHTPLHIPEVLYSWRIHHTSTSGNIHSKPFVYDSQRCVLTKLLETLAPTGRFRLEPSPLFGGMPDWWMRRDATDPRAVTTVVVGSPLDRQPRLEVPKEIPHEVVHLDPADGVGGLARLAARAAESGRLLHVLWHDTRIVDDVWALEAMGLFELFPDTAMVGGRLYQNGRIVDAGAYLGFGRGCDAPDRGGPLEDPGYHVQAWKQHSVSAVSLNHSVLDPKLALDALSDLARANVSLAHLGAWLGAAFSRQGRRVIYSPNLSAEPNIDLTAQVRDAEHEAFKRVNVDLMPDRRYLSPHVALRPPAYQPTSIEVRRRALCDPGPALTDAQMLEADRMARAVLPRASSQVSFSVLTSVYSRTPAQFFELTARSLLEQHHADFEWIVLENGPIGDDVLRVLDRIATDHRVQRFACAENAGIVGAMRQCLAGAGRRFVVPLDADDVLEPDALEVLAAVIDREQADFVFSDEDHLTDERVHTPYSRPGFDPVLNLESSYIWHLCAFSRERALDLGVYSDEGAEYCHDWDTIVRFSEAGLRIAHVPHVLYHWRTHAESQSNTDTQNPGSLASMRAVVEAVLARRSAAERYEIAEFPLFRGAVEWWIRRRPIGDPGLAVVVLGATQADVDGLAHSPGLSIASHVVPVRRRLDTLSDWRALGEALPRDVERIALLDLRCRPTTEEWVWEATKWFELQSDVAIVGGRILDDRDFVVDAGSRVTAGETIALYRRLHRMDAGAFALALKPQTIESPAEGFFVVERGFLEAAIESVTRDGFTRRLGATLGALAKMQHRRVIYSPLVEARRIRISRDDAPRVDDTFPVEEDSGLAQRAPNDAAPAIPALRLIAPADWQHVGTRPEFNVRTRDDEARGEVLLFRRDDYIGRGIERAARVASVRLEPADVAGVLVGMPAAPLPEGDYIVVLKESTGSVLSVSGVCLREAKDRWPRRFQAMLEEQSRFAIGRPAERPRRQGEPLFSITTAIHDADPAFVVALADSILSQRHDDFEWLVLDNGSHRPDTQRVSRDLAARDPRVRFWRVEDNLHIIGGNRFLLERARGTYVVPVDHDDVLYPDALRILCGFVAEHHEPDVLYSDEQKITLSGVAWEILWRPAWSNLAVLSTCPASHLMVYKRTLGLEAELYSADYARASPDWDSALRLATRTSHIVQVPFVLYGWRMHPGSTALNEDSKNYLAESQKSVVRHALERLDLADRFEVAKANDVLGYYHAVRRKQNGPRVLLHGVIPLDAPQDALTLLRSSLAHTRYEAISQRIYVPGQDEVGVGLADAAGEIGIGSVKPEVVRYRDEAELLSLMFTGEAIESGEVHIVLNPLLVVTNPDWIWEAIGTFELDPSTGIAGGCILNPDGRVDHIGYVSGLDGFFATPAHGQDMRFVSGQMGFIRRNVTAVYGSFMAVKREVLRAIGGLKGIDRSDGLYGIEFCLRAARHGIKTAYSPRMKATFDGQLAHPAGGDRALVDQIVAEYPAAGAPDPYYSRHCIPRADAFGSPIVE